MNSPHSSFSPGRTTGRAPAGWTKTASTWDARRDALGRPSGRTLFLSPVGPLQRVVLGMLTCGGGLVPNKSLTSLMDSRGSGGCKPVREGECAQRRRWGGGRPAGPCEPEPCPFSPSLSLSFLGQGLDLLLTIRIPGSLAETLADGCAGPTTELQVQLVGWSLTLVFLIN